MKRSRILWVALALATLGFAVYALRQPSSLKPTWTVRVDQSIATLGARPSGGVVFAAQGPHDSLWLDADGRIAARAQPQGGFLFPNVTQGSLISGTRGGLLQSYDEHGAVAWEIRLGQGAVSCIVDSVGTIYATSRAAAGAPWSLSCFDPAGNELSSQAWPAKSLTNYSAAADSSGRLFSDLTDHQANPRIARVGAFDSSGTALWRTPLAGHSGKRPRLTAQGDPVFVAHQDGVYCIDAATGRPQWVFRNPLKAGGWFHWYDTLPLPSGSTVITSSGMLHWVDPQGQVIRELQLGFTCGAPILAPDGSIYVTYLVTSVPRSFLYAWHRGQVRSARQAQAYQQFPVRYRTRSCLIHLSAEGRRLGAWNIGTQLLDLSVGSAGELYGYGWDTDSNGRPSGSRGTVYRFDPR